VLNPIENKEIESDLPGESKENLPKDPFTIEKVILVWEEFLHQLKEKDNRAYNGIKDTKISLLQPNQNDIVFTYVSQSSQSEFELHKSNFLLKIRSVLNNFLIQLISRVEELKGVNLVLRKDEVFQKMVEKNPLLQKLKEELDLNIY
jgi:DNA polymerase III subunit gamma/tau